MNDIREIAERLLGDLARAERQSGGWANAALGQALVNVALDRCLARLAGLSIWGRDNQLPSSEFWKIAGPVLERGSLHCRARFKPRGYAGDFETFQMFWERSTCADPLGRLFDEYFQRQIAVDAVRSRIIRVAELIAEKALNHDGDSFKIASIGSGPAIEIALAAKLMSPAERQRLHVQLMDLDDAALAHAQTRLGAILSSAQLSASRENLFRLPQRQDAQRRLPSADFIYCLGLFDYLDDDAATRLLRLMWQQTSPGGTLLVGNFGPFNPSRAYMEWFGNWYLRYRTPEQLLQIATASHISQDEASIGSDRTGVNLLLTCEKKLEN